MTPSRLRVLVAIALTLAGIRFVLIPWIEHQSAQHTGLEVLTKRVDRSLGLVERRESIERYSAVFSERLASARSSFPSAISSDQFRLVAQQQFGAIAQEAGVVLGVLDFPDEGVVDQAGLRFVRARLEVGGPLNRIARFHGVVEGRMRNALIRDFRLASPVLPMVAPNDMNVQAAVTLDVYFRAEPRGAGR